MPLPSCAYACVLTLNVLLVLLLQVNRAVDYVGGGTKALVEAKQYQKSKRKWCCCAIITLLVILIIVIVVVSACCILVLLSAYIPCMLHAARSTAACSVLSVCAVLASRAPLLYVEFQRACADACRSLLSTSCHSSTRISSERCRLCLAATKQAVDWMGPWLVLSLSCSETA